MKKLIKDIKDARESFIKMLKENTTPDDPSSAITLSGGSNTRSNNKYPTIALLSSNVQHSLAHRIQSEIAILPLNVKHSKSLIMEPYDIKMVVMERKMKQGHVIRQYYIDLEVLMKVYSTYQLNSNIKMDFMKFFDTTTSFRPSKSQPEKAQAALSSPKTPKTDRWIYHPVQSISIDDIFNLKIYYHLKPKPYDPIVQKTIQIKSFQRFVQNVPTLQYISACVFKQNSESQKSFTLPIPIKTYVNNIKPCCIFCVGRKEFSDPNIVIHAYKLALDRKHKECVKYIKDTFKDIVYSYDLHNFHICLNNMTTNYLRIAGSALSF